MTSVRCSNSDCKHCDNGHCQLNEVLIDWDKYLVGGFYIDIPFCSDYEQEVHDD